ncbi:hypothetical protein ESA94_11735 [Lacibacter luteus]|uniref:Uncharacterized protein n=1 Tax=Lacibacter luteus TaxID=2508719 RepID=A0A4Q1CHZ9_9BACT|nr:hypothetical protein [Lacibacter luteus]RXK59725.1 hypothetical protein ESA94_11735 [Lacibacter luteus]
MQQKLIRISYTKQINSSNTALWDQLVFNSSWQELMMQAQFYNQQQHTTFRQLVQQVPSAEKLHFLVSSSVVGYLRQLNGIIPDVQSKRGVPLLPFNDFKFEIIDSDFNDKSKHNIQLTFFSDPVLWHETIGDSILISNATEPQTTDGALTHLLQLQPALDIYSYKTVTV